MPYPGLVHPEQLPLGKSTADLYLCRRLSNPVLAQSLWGLWVLVRIQSGPLKGLFEPSKHLWRVWGLILNVILHLLPSCWGFSFALGRGVSFSGGIQHSPFDGCSQQVVIFGGK